MLSGTARFRRTARLIGPGGYSRVFRKPTRSVDSLFVVFSRENGGSNARLGMVVSKRAVRRAVDRNRLKRQIRESFRQNQYRLVGFYFIVKAQSGVVDRENAQIQRSLAGHWKKLVEE